MRKALLAGLAVLAGSTIVVGASVAVANDEPAKDLAGPSITPRFEEYPGVVRSGTYWVDIDVTDESRVDRAELRMDGETYPIADGKAMITFGDQSRRVTGEIHAWDEWGNEAVLARTWTVDAEGPIVKSVTPKPNALVRGKRITSTVQASDPVGIKGARFGGGSTILSAPWTDSIAVGRDGRYRIGWLFFDSWDQDTVISHYVIVDNTKPTLKIGKAPKNNAKVKGTVKVTATAQDRNGVNRVELLVNGKVAAKDTKAGYAFSINTKKYGKKIKFALRAYDRAGNVTTTPTRTWKR